MTHPKQDKPVIDHSFSAFLMGLTVGIAGALLLGTKDGRKLTEKVIKNLPKTGLNLDRLTNHYQENKSPKSTPPPVIPPPDDHFPQEPPPPPPPTIERNQTRFFHSS